MGKLLVKNWRRFVILLGAVVLCFLLYYKVTWKPTIIDDYLRSDIIIERDVIDSVKTKTSELTEDAKEGAEKAENAIRNETKKDETTGSRSIVGWVIILAIACFGALILDAIMTPSDDKAKKKK